MCKGICEETSTEGCRRNLLFLDVIWTEPWNLTGMPLNTEENELSETLQLFQYEWTVLTLFIFDGHISVCWTSHRFTGIAVLVLCAFWKSRPSYMSVLGYYCCSAYAQAPLSAFLNQKDQVLRHCLVQCSLFVERYWCVVLCTLLGDQVPCCSFIRYTISRKLFVMRKYKFFK